MWLTFVGSALKLSLYFQLSRIPLEWQAFYPYWRNVIFWSFGVHFCALPSRFCGFFFFYAPRLGTFVHTGGEGLFFEACRQ